MNRSSAFLVVRRIVAERHVGAVYLFGSAINALGRDSDVDIIIISPRRRLRADLDYFRQGVKKSLDRHLHIQLFHRSDIRSILKFFRHCGPRHRCK
jgi:predicted nucleotidyltransferase